MLLKFVHLFIIFISNALHVNAENRTNEPCGSQTSENPYPWLVGIEHQYETSTRILCTGALIGKRHVISKAECFGDKLDIMSKSVLLGFYNTLTRGSFSEDVSSDSPTNEGVTRVQIEMVLKFSDDLPLYTSFNYHDVALVVLRELLTYTDIIRPVCLPSANIMRSKSDTWDLHHVAIYLNTANRLGIYETVATHVDKRKCNKARYGLFFISDHICANDTLSTDVCVRRGSLLMNKRGGTYELVGLSEQVAYCSSARIFTNFYIYLNWLQRKIPEWTRDCGRRKVQHVELIVNGEDTKPGEWPWHAAIYERRGFDVKYKCGGTLISKIMVLTAAHCATANGEPVLAESVNVVLGKHNLISRELESQEKQVDKVIVHEKYASRDYLKNDIALLKLKSEALYSNYIQPACWTNGAYDRLANSNISGSVVGWGFDETKKLSFQLKQASMPMVDEVTCIKKKPLFYVNALHDSKFCAGWANGTSSCNGDSGGGFFVFIPDISSVNSSDVQGSWYVRGIVSLTISLKKEKLCDPNEYVVFTDVADYYGWIRRHLDD